MLQTTINQSHKYFVFVIIQKDAIKNRSCNFCQTNHTNLLQTEKKQPFVALHLANHSDIIHHHITNIIAIGQAPYSSGFFLAIKQSCVALVKTVYFLMPDLIYNNTISRIVKGFRNKQQNHNKKIFNLTN